MNWGADKLYRLFRPFVQVHGESYEPHCKMLFYSILGQAMRDNMLKDGIIYLDTRINLAFGLPPESGKFAFVWATKQAMRGLGSGHKIEEPTWFHPQSLVGRVDKHREDGEDIYDAQLGVLSKDWVIFDDALDLFTSSDANNQESRRFLLKALDPMHRNKITKPQTGVPEEHYISFYPKCSVSIFFQPYELKNILVETGFLRRFLMVTNSISYEEREEALLIKENPGGEPDHEGWDDFMSDLASFDFSWHLRDDAFKLAGKLSKNLLYGAEKCGLVTMEYAQRCLFTTRNLILRLAMIQAATRFDGDIKEGHVRKAASDLDPVIRASLGFVSKNLTDYTRIPPEAWSALRHTRMGMDSESWTHTAMELSPKSNMEFENYLSAWKALKYSGAIETDSGVVSKVRLVY